MWEDISRISLGEFKELYEMLAVVDIRWKCSFKRFYEMGHTVLELVGGAMSC